MDDWSYSAVVILPVHLIGSVMEWSQLCLMEIINCPLWDLLLQKGLNGVTSLKRIQQLRCLKQKDADAHTLNIQVRVYIVIGFISKVHYLTLTSAHSKLKTWLNSMKTTYSRNYSPSPLLRPSIILLSYHHPIPDLLHLFILFLLGYMNDKALHHSQEFLLAIRLPSLSVSKRIMSSSKCWITAIPLHCYRRYHILSSYMSPSFVLPMLPKSKDAISYIYLYLNRE